MEEVIRLATLARTQPENREKHIADLAAYLREFPSGTQYPRSADEAIQIGEMACRATPVNHPHRANRLHGIGRYFYRFFSKVGELILIEKAIQYGQLALDSLSERHPDRSEYLSELATYFRSRFLRKGEVEDIQRAIDFGQQALNRVSDHDHNTIHYRNNLGVYYQERFAIIGDISDLEEAIRLGESCLQCPEEHSNHGEHFNNLGKRFHCRYLTLGHQKDLKTAISLMEHSLSKTTAGHPKLAVRLNNLARMNCDRYLASADVTYLDEAMRLGQQAVDCPSDDYSHHAEKLNNLGNYYQEQFRRSGDLENLIRAIALGKVALGEIPTGHPDRPVFLASLSSRYSDCHLRTGDINELQEAIRHIKEAIDLTPEGHPDIWPRLNNLAMLYQERYLQLSNSEDLREAIRTERGSINKIPIYHRTRWAYLNNLGYSLSLSFQRTMNMGDLEEAITVTRQALEDIPAGHPGYATCLNNLGNYLGNRYDIRHQIMDLDESIRIGREAINATPENHPNLIYRLNNLGSHLCDKFSATSELKFIEEAIELGQKAVRVTPESHSLRAQLLYNLGVRFEVLFSQTRNLDDIHESARLMRESLHSQFGVPLTRIIAGISVAQKLIRFFKWSESASILQYVFDLLPKIALRTSSRDDLQHTIEKIAGASTLAASVFLKAGLGPLHALQMLEQGRGIISGLVIDARSDVSLLREHHRDLYYRYDQARKAVAMPPSSAWLLDEAELPHSSNNRYALESLQRHEASRKLDEVLQEIRKQPDFERFQLAPTEKEILGFAGLGPLVSFNVSEVSAEAFIVTKSVIKVLPLPNIQKSELLQNVKILANQGNQSRRDAELISDKDEQSAPEGSTRSGHHLSEISSRMSSLWVNAIKPVLDELGLITARKPLLQELPRIWWVGGGLMSVLPLHAAGDHVGASANNTLTYVVSSFAPTFKSLQFARSTPWKSLKEKKPKVLVVCMPQTPGIPGELNVGEEAAAIESAVGTDGTVKYLMQPSKEAVLKEFDTATICHFACHGRSHALDPAKSALLLGKSEVEELTIGDLDTVFHPQAQIAYLSACSTAEIRRHSLIDESVHLASTFLLSGFPHVIGTLWGAQDNAALEIARTFYKVLFQNYHRENGSPSYALHNAIIHLRNANPEDILKWAPFIHIGP